MMKIELTSTPPTSEADSTQPRYKVQVTVREAERVEILDFESLTGEQVGQYSGDLNDEGQVWAFATRGGYEIETARQAFYTLDEWGLLPEGFQIDIEIERIDDE